MNPPIVDLPLRRGDSATLKVFLLLRDVLTRELVVDQLDGARITWEFAFPGDAPTIKSSDPTGGLTIGVTEASVSLPMTPEQTQALPPGSYRHRLRVKTAAGETTTRLTGNVVVTE